MAFKVPFTFAPLGKLKKRSIIFKKFVRQKANTKLERYLINSDEDINREEYLSICFRGIATSFPLLLLLILTTLLSFKVSRAILLSFGLAFLLTLFVFFLRLLYPKIYDSRKQRQIDKNLIPALQDILIQLSSGVPLFSVLVNISSADYVELTL